MNSDKTISPGTTEPDPEFSPTYSDADLLDRAPYEYEEWDEGMQDRYRTLTARILGS